MNTIKKYWYSKIVWPLIFLLIVIMIFVRLEIDSYRNYETLYDEISNKYAPVRIETPIPPGYILQEEDGRKISFSTFHIKNYSKQEQKITFVLYQHYWKTQDYQLFNIDRVYVCHDIETKVEMENGVIEIPGGAEMWINVEGVARDPSNVVTSRSGPDVRVVVLD